MERWGVYKPAMCGDTGSALSNSRGAITVTDKIQSCVYRGPGATETARRTQRAMGTERGQCSKPYPRKSQRTRGQRAEQSRRSIPR